MLSYPRIFISAGERSGDRFGASLASAILEMNPEARIFGVGGPRMEAAGVKVLADTIQHAGMGLQYALANTGGWIKVFRRCIRQFNAEPPDVLVPIDNPGFNLRLAGHARERGIPVCYYVSPQVWAWLPHRIHRIARLVDRMMAILPFEKKMYDDLGVDCRYVGHPLMDYMTESALDDAAKQKFMDKFGGNVVGLLPGSRPQEVTHSFPLIADAAAAIADAMPETVFLVAAASVEHVPELQALLDSRGVKATILVGRTPEVMQCARVCIVVSGTATLETAYFRTPMIVVYRAGSWAKHIAPRMLKVRHISLVNILGNREVVPEFLKFNDDAAGIADAALRLLKDEDAWRKCRAGLEEVMVSLGPAGASRRAAEAVLDLASR